MNIIKQNYDRTVLLKEAVKGAVDDCSSSVKKDIFLTNDKWPNWSIFK